MHGMAPVGIFSRTGSYAGPGLVAGDKGAVSTVGYGNRAMAKSSLREAQLWTNGPPFAANMEMQRRGKRALACAYMGCSQSAGGG